MKIFLNLNKFSLETTPPRSVAEISIIFAKFAKMWEAIVIQYGKRFLMQLLDADDEFSEAVAMNRRLEHINHLARQFCQKTPNFCIST